MASDPLIQAWIKHALQWEEEQEAEQGYMEELNKPPNDFSKYSTAQWSTLRDSVRTRRLTVVTQKEDFPDKHIHLPRPLAHGESSRPY
jgi:hypothetical protein